MSNEKISFNEINNMLGFLCRTKEDEQNLQYLSEYIQYLKKENDIVKVVLKRSKWHILSCSSSELNFNFGITGPLTKVLAFKSYGGPDISSEICSWCEPWDWLRYNMSEDIDMSLIEFVLSTPYGCYFSINKHRVFIDRDYPEAGLLQLKGKKVDEDYSHPFASAEFENQQTSSLFLKLVRYFIEEKDQPVFYKVSVFRTKHRLNAIRELSKLMDLKLNEAKAIVDGFSPIAQTLDYESASKLEKQLEDIGIEVLISDQVSAR
ncbi:MAG TPA: hypothetical protein DCS93_09125 [Microscillaceae bacterium]|nr:hypothetical protein [Microscillaceae bacterium]